MFKNANHWDSLIGDNNVLPYLSLTANICVEQKRI
uniref:Uncharacterized protein n=1 Tax=Anguilla anguilla TaxID=7936 RepID=A0A0E9U082_ANGAN